MLITSIETPDQPRGDDRLQPAVSRTFDSARRFSRRRKASLEMSAGGVIAE
jgi:hypothetical protein